MSFDSVFHGTPNSINFLSSGQASFGIDASSGVLYFRTPANGSWQKCSGSGNSIAGGLGGSIQFNSNGIISGASSTTPAMGGGILTASFTTIPSGTPRSNFTASLGYQFTVSSSIAVSQLGRLFLSGNTQNHKVNLWISTNQNTPLATGIVLATSPSDSNGFKYVSITPVTLSPGNTYVIAVDEVSGGDTWCNLFTPTLQSVFNTPVLSAYTTTIDSYPNNNASGNGSFSTPAMQFVTDAAVLNQNSPNINISGSYWTGLTSATDVWNIEDILGSGSNPSSTLNITHSGTSGFSSVFMSNLSVNSLVSNSNGAIGFFSSLSQLDVVNSNNPFGNAPGGGTLSGLLPYGTSICDIAGSAIGGGIASPASSSSSSVTLGVGLESIPNVNQGGTGGGDVHGTGFISLKVANLVPTSNVNSAFYFSGAQISVDNYGSGDTYEISGVRGFANNLGSSTQTWLIGGDFEMINNPSGGVTQTAAAIVYFAEDFGATGTTTALYGIYGTVLHGGTGTLSSEYGIYAKSGGNLITNDYSLFVDSPDVGNTINNHYGLYIADQTIGGGLNPNPWGIFVAGGKCSFPTIVESATLSPTSAATAGVTGQIAWDSGKIYVCTAGGIAGAATWKAATLTSV